MTSKEFVTWIKGFIEGKKGKPYTEHDIKLISMKAESVIDPEDLSFNPQRDQPFQPMQPLPWIDPTAPNPWSKPSQRCPKCNIDFNGFMGYVCPDLECPMGAGPITCNIKG